MGFVGFVSWAELLRDPEFLKDARFEAVEKVGRGGTHYRGRVSRIVELEEGCTLLLRLEKAERFDKGVADWVEAGIDSFIVLARAGQPEVKIDGSIVLPLGKNSEEDFKSAILRPAPLPNGPSTPLPSTPWVA